MQLRSYRTRFTAAQRQRRAERLGRRAEAKRTSTHSGRFLSFDEQKPHKGKSHSRHQGWQERQRRIQQIQQGRLQVSP